MASTPLPLKIIETSRVAPSPSITPDCASLPFTFFDLIMIKFTPVDRLFFYSYRSTPHRAFRILSSHLPQAFSLAHTRNILPTGGRLPDVESPALTTCLSITIKKILPTTMNVMYHS